MSWTNAAVTEAGLALQAKLVDGQTLGFLRVAAGTGTVDPSVLANQIALANEKQTLTFQPPNVLDGAKIKVPVMLNNIGLETGYMMQQLGFFADDPDNGEILYAIVQDEVGDAVPSQTESPGFVIEWAFVFQYGNADSVTVTLDPVGLVSIGMVGQPNGVAGLDENGTVPVAQGGTGETTAQAALAALGAGVRPNELDNAYFVGGGTGWGVFPVNQRGKTRYSYPEHQNVFDRWKITDGQAVIELVEDGIIIRDGKAYEGAVITFTQSLPHVLNDDIFTLSCIVTEMKGTWFFACNSLKSANIPIAVGINEGIIPKENAVLQSKDFYFYKTSSGADDYIKVMAVKIERGAGQTLAYQDDEGFIHLLPQPDSNYASQLLRCQRYFQLYSSADVRPAKAIDCRPVMRIDPTPGTLQIDEQTYYYNSAEL